MADDSNRQLQYATSDSIPWHRRKSNRQVFAVLIVVAIAWVVWTYGPTFWRGVVFLDEQRRAANTPLSPARVLVSNSTTQPAVVDQSLTDAILRYHAAWRGSQRMYPSATPGTPIFIQKRVTEGGDDRIIVVHARMTGPGLLKLQGYSFEYWPAWRVLTRSLNRSHGSSTIGASDIEFRVEPGETVQLYGGRADPADPSRFSFRMVIGSNDVEVRGHLLDGDHDPSEPVAIIDFETDLMKRTAGSGWSGRKKSKP